MNAAESSAKPSMRHYREGDHEALADIFTRAVHETASADYDAAQRAAWAPLPPDLDWWWARCELKRPFIGTVGDAIAGFLELDPDGHIDCAYVSPAFARRGVMTLLLTHAETVCRAFGLERMYAEVSITACPIFERQGFLRLSGNEARRGGLVLINHLMEKPLLRSAQ